MEEDASVSLSQSVLEFDAEGGTATIEVYSKSLLPYQWRCNRLHGSETIVLGSQQYTKKDGKGKADVFANAIKHDHKSPCYTTRWSDVIKIR